MFLRYTVYMLLFLCVFASSAWAQNKVGFVNTQRILEETELGKTAQEDLARLSTEKDKQINESAQQIIELKEELSLYPHDKGLQKELEALSLAHEELKKQCRADLRKEEEQLIQFLLKHADESLRKIAHQEGFSMVLTDPNIVGYLESSADLTDLVIQEMNKD